MQISKRGEHPKTQQKKTQAKKPVPVVSDNLDKYDFILKKLWNSENDDKTYRIHHWKSPKPESNPHNKLPNRISLIPTNAQTTRHNYNNNQIHFKSNEPINDTNSNVHIKNNDEHTEDIKHKWNGGNKAKTKRSEIEDISHSSIIKINDECETTQLPKSSNQIPITDGKENTQLSELKTIRRNQYRYKDNVTKSSHSSKKNTLVKNPSSHALNKQSCDIMSFNSNNSSCMINSLMTRDSSRGKIRKKSTPTYMQQITNETNHDWIQKNKKYSFHCHRGKSQQQSNTQSNNYSLRQSKSKSKSQSYIVSNIKQRKVKVEPSILSRTSDKSHKLTRKIYTDEFLRSCSGEHCENRDALCLEKSVANQKYDFNLKTMKEWIDQINTNGFKKGKETIRKQSQLSLGLKSAVNTMNLQLYKIDKWCREVNASTTKWNNETIKRKGLISKNAKENKEYHIEIVETRQLNASILSEIEKVKDQTKIWNEKIISEANDTNIKKGTITKLNSKLSDCFKEKERISAKMCLIRKQIKNMRVNINYEFNKNSNLMLNVDDWCVEQNLYDKINRDNV